MDSWCLTSIVHAILVAFSPLFRSGWCSPCFDGRDTAVHVCPIGHPLTLMRFGLVEVRAGIHGSCPSKRSSSEVDGRWIGRCPSVVHGSCPSKRPPSVVDGRWVYRCPSVVHGSCPFKWSPSEVDGRWVHRCPSVVFGELPCVCALSVARFYWSGWGSVPTFICPV
jgi:hypothetical protein